MSRSIRVGIIGTGFGAAVQLPGFLGLKEAEVIGIASHDPKRSEELKKKYKLPQSFASYEELLESDDIDLISITTIPTDHEKLVRAAIKSGKHILCEKPFGMTAESAKTMLKEANAMGIIHATDFEFRELPALKFLLARLMTGAVGRIQTGEFRWIVGTWADATRPWRWQCDKALGGGVLTALGVHLFNAVELMLGPQDKIKAEIGTAVPERKDEEGKMKPVTSEDHATMDLKGKYGIPVKLALSNIDPEGPGLSIKITGEKGILLLESTSPVYGAALRVREGTDEASAKTVYEDPAPNPKVDARIPPFQALAKRLLIAIQEGDRTFSPSFQDGVRAQAFLQTVHESAKTGKVVDLFHFL